MNFSKLQLFWRFVRTNWMYWFVILLFPSVYIWNRSIPRYELVSGVPIKFEAVFLEDLERCYKTQILGTDVFRLDNVPECPDQAKIERIERSYVRWAKADSEYLDDSVVVFTGQPVKCGEHSERGGCSDGRRSAVVLEGSKAFGWGLAYQEELGHVLSLQRHGHTDINHERPYYPHKWWSR